ncbi:imidazole glycerol phosphate synthase subunit HisH [Xanthomonas campestris pv. raphani]|jgi:glutamine amidotransferase|uniref:Imidazole glycerol phosphate synthase subunit HisH n=2 Tax=Xanthomonas campestris pv. campestris TaxID=340 RepID=HIS5_XANCP|nr:imidazole glycerol phosphate synthase subunit HisH [Xanthomonas campestris]Q4UU43.1 RecName: Full=Imidazole glycerol phosphate synthase subunit HisH; AltName: Full=IGP synthase glutaminase subunit; AltName: Full=IGP synthase subunit HisH; AltName: Full=ImGP synthase subunit HisH; Short=IGPS subunit HisH [Xanthomonas campestris pv. campestris str. 8004]Q8P9P1.1 RecName: Full=Imidazole glycerol phosphate synthase subunit HisH; AltName: Full=IGP synthase glutaminase subunit; AltName: Full=IGP syn
MTDLALIDAGGANLGSVRYALERLGVEARVVRDAQGLQGAERVILPGVGAAPEAMARLRAQGLIEPLQQLQVPLIGICLGMQLLFEHSEEGDVDCLGMLPGIVRHMTPALGIRVPHMGWNQLVPMRDSALLAGLPERASAYFVHGYAAPVTADTVAACDHGGLFTAVVQSGLRCGAQFHPERSADTGARILRNFLEMSFP